MAARAPEAAMYRGRKFLSVHVERKRFAGSRGAHALLAVAGEAFRSGLVGGACGALRKQQGENRGDEGRNDNSQSSTALLSDIFCFSHICFSHVKLSGCFINALQLGRHVPRGARARELGRPSGT